MSCLLGETMWSIENGWRRYFEIGISFDVA